MIAILLLIDEGGKPISWLEAGSKTALLAEMYRFALPRELISLVRNWLRWSSGKHRLGDYEEARVWLLIKRKEDGREPR